MAYPLPGRSPAEVRPMPLLSDRAYERTRLDIICCMLACGIVRPAILTSSSVLNLALGVSRTELR